MTQHHSNPWKTATIAIIASVVGALAAGVVVARVSDARNELEQQAALDPTEPEGQPIPEVEPEAQPVAQPVAQPAPVAAAKPNIEDCERYRYKTRTDGGRVVKNGLIGGALGAGVGAAGGAIGGSAGKGAGIGALAGAAVGTGYTLHDEHKQKQASRDAYHACLNRNRS